MRSCQFFSAALFAFLINVHKTQADASTCYWVGDTAPANWNDASHWSSSSGGAGSTCNGGVVPGSDDIVVFDSANTNGVTLDISPTVASIINTGNYSGEFNMNGNNLTVAGDFTFKGGSVLAGAGALGVGGGLSILMAQLTLTIPRQLHLQEFQVISMLAETHFTI